MIVEIGHFALALALCAALAQAVVPLWGARVGDDELMDVGRSAALTQFALIAIAFAALVNAHLTSDFSVLNVAENSHSAMPADLQDLRRLGEPRRLDAAVGPHPRGVRRAGRASSAARCRARCAPTRSPFRA